MDNTIIVSGATGFVGSYLCKELVGQGQNVLGLSHSSNVKRVASLIGNNKFNVTFGDIRDKDRLAEIFSTYPIKTVFHLAALVPYMDDDDLFGVNVMGTRNLLGVAYKNKVQEFIYASSMGVYSVPPESLPVSENHPTKPNVKYGQTKLTGELLCKAMSKAMKVVVVRYAGVFGRNMNETRALPTFIGDALNNRPVSVDGDGTHSSDFCHVDDITNGTILAWQKGRTEEVYNIGSGQDTRLIDLAYKVVELTHSKSKVVLVGNKVDRSFRFYLDIEKAKRELGYEPNPFNERLREYVGSY